MRSRGATAVFARAPLPPRHSACRENSRNASPTIAVHGSFALGKRGGLQHSRLVSAHLPTRWATAYAAFHA